MVKGAAFRIPANPLPDDAAALPDDVQQLIGTLVVCEGLEDALSVHHAIPFIEVRGIPGIGRMRHVTVKQGEKILIFADGDAPDSEATKALSKGIDHLLLQGAVVSLARPSDGKDANSLLIQGGTAAVLSVALAATPAMLSPRGRVTQLSQLHHLEYEQVRRSAAKQLGMRASALDHEVSKLRHGDGPDENNKPAWATWEDTVWPAPIANISEVCDEALREVTRYVVGNPDELSVVVMWGLFSHFVHHPIIELNISPRLAIKAPTKECGKTTLLEAVSNLVPRPNTQSGAVSETTFRHLVDEQHVCVLIDEAHEVFRRHAKEGNLLGILKASHRRYAAGVVLAGRGGAVMTKLSRTASSQSVCRYGTTSAALLRAAGIWLGAVPAIRQLAFAGQDHGWLVVRGVRNVDGRVDRRVCLAGVEGSGAG